MEILYKGTKEIYQIESNFNKHVRTLDAFFDFFYKKNEKKCLIETGIDCQPKDECKDKECIRAYNKLLNENIKKGLEKIFANQIRWTAISYYSIREDKFLINEVTFKPKGIEIEADLEKYSKPTDLYPISELAQKILRLHEFELINIKVNGKYISNKNSFIKSDDNTTKNKLSIVYIKNILTFNFTINDCNDCNYYVDDTSINNAFHAYKTLHNIINNKEKFRKLVYGLLILFSVDPELKQMTYSLIRFGDNVSNFGINVGFNKYIEDFQFPEKLNIFIKYHYNFIALKEQKLRLEKEALKTAIISILIDSYAHNISAHSLAALKWWIELRHKMLDKRIKVDANDIKISELLPKIEITGRKPQTDKGSVKTDDKGNILFEDDDPLYKTTQKYYEALGLTDSTYNASYYSLYDYLQFVDDKNIAKDLFKFNTPQKLKEKDEYRNEKEFYPRFPVPIDYALFPFFRFLRDKGAFWSGVTRDMAFGGESKTWYKILWEDFANNPLYLGTIAKSESITKININLDVNICGKKHKGRFVTIDMSVIDYEEKLSQSLTLDAEINNDEVDLGNCDECKDKYVEQKNYSKYAFVKLGKCFAKFRDILDNEEDCRVFLPGGIVGEHALFTIFENTIRNIKHYKEKLDDIKKEGIDLWISIEDSEIVNTKPKRNQLFKVGVWLGHATEIVKDRNIEAKLVKIFNGSDDNKEEIKGRFIISERRGNNIKGKFEFINEEVAKLSYLLHSDNEFITNFEIDTQGLIRFKGCNEPNLKEVYIEINKDETLEPFYLLFNITEQTLKPILDENGTPRMGGNSQDKACAAMLFNNKFGHVETKDKPRDKEYFPWIFFSTSCNTNEFPLNYYFDDKPEKIEELKKNYELNILCNGKTGLLKKYFYLWRGEDVFVVNSENDFNNENVSRFRFVVIQNEAEKEKLIRKAREEGVIRILDRKLNKNTLYNSWIIKWCDLKFNSNRYFVYETNIYEPSDKRSSSFGVFVVGNKTTLFIGRMSKYWIDYLSKIVSNSEQYGGKGISFSHSSTQINDGSICNARSHGWFLSRLFEGCNGSEKVASRFPKERITNIPNNRLDKYEFLEAILTDVRIFDDRIFSRFSTSNKNEISKQFIEQLNLIVYPEDKNIFNNEVAKIKSKPPNFLVIHLSFIKELGYDDKNMNDFISKYNLMEIHNNSKKRFFLVITTGRGREDWWNKLSEPNRSFTIYKPVESLLNAVESAISYKDDIEVKYNLIKVLFGS